MRAEIICRIEDSSAKVTRIELLFVFGLSGLTRSSRMRFLVFVKCAFGGKSDSAVATHTLGSGMLQAVHPQCARIREADPAFLARKRLLACVSADMALESAAVCEAIAAEDAGVGPFACVHAVVDSQMVLSCES